MTTFLTLKKSSSGVYMWYTNKGAIKKNMKDVVHERQVFCSIRGCQFLDSSHGAQDVQRSDPMSSRKHD